MNERDYGAHARRIRQKALSDRRRGLTPDGLDPIFHDDVPAVTLRKSTRRALRVVAGLPPEPEDPPGPAAVPLPTLEDWLAGRALVAPVPPFVNAATLAELLTCSRDCARRLIKSGWCGAYIHPPGSRERVVLADDLVRALRNHAMRPLDKQPGNAKRTVRRVKRTLIKERIEELRSKGVRR